MHRTEVEIRDLSNVIINADVVGRKHRFLGRVRFMVEHVRRPLDLETLRPFQSMIRWQFSILPAQRATWPQTSIGDHFAILSDKVLVCLCDVGK